MSAGAEVHVPEPGLSLLVISGGLARRVPLPERGVLVVGSGDHADVRVSDPRVEQAHARLHLGEALAVEDLGSAAGTSVGARPLERGATTRVAPGTAIEVGGAVLLVQGHLPPRQDEYSARRAEILGALARTSGNQTRAARLLGVSRRTLVSWMLRYKVQRPHKALPAMSAEDEAWREARARIIEALERCSGNQTRAARLLGISRRTLVERMVTHRVPRPRKPLPSE